MSTPTKTVEATRRGVDEMQLGHIKRLQQIADYPPGEWSGMGRAAHQGDDFSGYRFQLAFGAYALALGHRHRLPNAPVMFKSAFSGLVDKLLRADVWMYWKDVSQGGSMFNAHLGRLSEEWDPVARDNIMYSAYLQSAATMFNVLFDDDRYAQPGALSFRFNALFWGHGDKDFTYDQNSLTDVLYWQMVQNGYLGIACEPNCVFQPCNQPAILGFRMHDQLTGGNIADDVVAGYKKAHAEYGHVGENGHYNMLVLEDSKMLVQNAEKYAWVDGWVGAMMNAWNREFVREHYAAQVADVLVEESCGWHAVGGVSGRVDRGGSRYRGGDFGRYRRRRLRLGCGVGLGDG
ncbi:MAG: hypothetical protein U5N53_02825 [Mycobacterium sp.]|nr:hypothetical protein [Mycobacterium sp.]